METMQRKLHAVDRAVVGRRGMREMLVGGFSQARRAGGLGMSADRGRP